MTDTILLIITVIFSFIGLIILIRAIVNIHLDMKIKRLEKQIADEARVKALLEITLKLIQEKIKKPKADGSTKRN